MPYLAVFEDQELELPDRTAIAAAALKDGRITPETWIADVDIESDWETVEEKFPQLCGQQ